MAGKAETNSDDEGSFVDYQRELALIDEILGLRAKLAQEGVRNSPSRETVERLTAENLALRRSATWRVGRVAMLPVRILGRILRSAGS